MARMLPTSSWRRWRTTGECPRIFGTLLGLLAVLACSCGGGDGTAGGAGGQGGRGAGGAAGGSSEASRDAAADLAANPDGPAGSDVAFWTTPFVANCTPPSVGGRSQNDGHHHSGEDCMQSGCHTGGSPNGSGGPAFLFGGTVRRAGSLALYPSVEVAVKTSTALHSACSATNGNFWIVAADAGSLDWSTAKVRVRSSNGESAMTSIPADGCNGCHLAAIQVTAP